jgi:hypothetical protein
MGLRVVIGVGRDLEAGPLEKTSMVLPTGVADQHLSLRIDSLEKIRADLQRAGAAERLRGDQPARRDQRGIGPEKQFLHRSVIGGEPFDRQVATRNPGLDARAFGLADGPQQRNPTVVVAVDPDAEVDFAGTRVRHIRFGQSEDRIAGGQLNGVKD